MDEPTDAATPAAPPIGRYLVHAQPGEIREGELYWDHGWYFTRMFEGTVKIRFKWGTNEGTAMIPRADWEAIVQHVAAEGVAGDVE